jgi:homoserine kinase type II
MAVYTQLSDTDIKDFLSAYNVGELKSFKGIAEGISNTKYLLTANHESQTTNYILTLFEKNFNAADLPFFMSLTEHLANKGIACPRPIHNKNNKAIGAIKGKPAILIEFLHGQGNPHITPEHTYQVGAMSAKLHLATQDFPQTRANDLSISHLQNMFVGFRDHANEINVGLKQEIETELDFLAKNFPKNLPSGIVHTDIFPDNVFFIDGNTVQPELSGIIDFYFSCTDFWMYDLAVTLNAWCFNSAHDFEPARATALFNGYNSIRQITEQEKNALNILARAAAMRFLCTRAHDWLNPVDGALVNRKDPMEYVKKLRFWQESELQTQSDSK